jgi:hypothetical protein
MVIQSANRVHEMLQEVACFLIGELAICVEELAGSANIRFWLLHGRHVQKYERLPEMMVRAKPANGAG